MCYRFGALLDFHHFNCQRVLIIGAAFLIAAAAISDERGT